MLVGLLFGGVFLALLLVAGPTSVIAALEVMTAIAHDSLGWSRRQAVVMLSSMWFLVSVPVTLFQAPWSHLRVGDMNLLQTLDFLVGTYRVPVGGIILALFVATTWGWPAFRDETNVGSGPIKVTALWRPLIQFLIPAAVLLVFLAGMGLLPGAS